MPQPLTISEYHQRQLTAALDRIRASELERSAAFAGLRTYGPAYARRLIRLFRPVAAGPAQQRLFTQLGEGR